MKLFYNLYLVCLTGTIFFSAVSVLLFIKLDIRAAWRVLGKKDRKKDRKKKTNRKTDRLKKERKKAGDVRYFKGREQGTVLLHAEKKDFCVKREILVVHTDEVTEI